MHDILSKMTIREKAELCVDSSMLRTKEFPHHGIPKLVMTDGTSGVRINSTPDADPKLSTFLGSLNLSFDSPDALAITERATCFPAGSSLACSWDPNLAEQIGAAVAEECKRLNVGLLYGPGLNTRRSPLDGRGFEYYSEDPIVAGDMAAGYVKGLQDHDVAACVKHFACNNSNYMRTIYNNIVDMRALREIYLAAFERVIQKAKPAAVMGSYNLINGVQSCENKWLLTDVLRQEWNYEGVVLSDCGAVKNHLEAFRAGLDYEMGHSIIAINKLVAAVEQGVITEKELDTHCDRILDVVYKYSREGKERPVVNFEANHQLAQEAASQCAVLLKNSSKILPLNRSSSIAIIGSWAVKPVFQGTGCAIVNAKKIDNPLEEIRHYSDHITFSPGYDDVKQNNECLLRQAEDSAKMADIAVIFAGAMLPLETDDYNRKDMNIEPAHEELIRRVSAVNPNTVVVLMNCESVVMPWIDSVKAVLDLWYCGEGCGKAVAQLLFGEKNPGGKLPVTMPKRICDCPDYLHFPGENHKHLYSEGIFVGYRYYDRKEIEPLFPFGHGLSYTEFRFSNLEFSAEEITLPQTIQARCTICNIGNCEGSEVVQLYISDDHARLHRPVRELKAFEKVFLKPGDSKTVVFTLDKRAFSYYDPEFNDWIVDSGEFVVSIGSSSRDIRLQSSITVRECKRYLPITTDSHYNELFDNPQAKTIFFNTLISWGLINESDVTPELELKLFNSFWGIAQHLDLLIPYTVTEQMVQDLVDKMNRCTV